MKLVPYSEYKNAELRWIGKIPAHWTEKRAKYYFKEVDERSQTGEEEMLSVSHITGVTPRSQKNVTMFMAESNVGQKLCQPGDLVVNTMWAWMAAMGISNHTGIVSPSYGVYRPRHSQDYDPHYLDHLFRTEKYRSEYICRSTGIRSSRLRLYPDKFLSMPVICPPLEEQQVISRFLKAQDHLFRKFIRNKRRLIELLKEQKQNIVNQAVTRGIDPDVKLKPSGVEWLGEIPEHWEARRLKTIAYVVLGKMLKPSPSKGDQLKPYLRSANIQWFEPNVSDVSSMWFSLKEMEQYRISKNDILVSEGGEVGRACIWQNELEDCYIQNSVHKITAGAEISPHFLLYQFSTFSSRDVFKAIVNRVSIAHLTREKLTTVYFCKPPIEEQMAIVVHLQKIISEISQAITREEHEIDLMREYRNRLISDVVTGKVDVRNWQEETSAPKILSLSKKEISIKEAPIQFKRAVFAAEIIARLHQEPTFGHVKLEKILFLAENLCELDLGSEYHRHAAGPYDSRSLRSIDSQIKKQKWFAVEKVESRYFYRPLEKVGSHEKYFNRYFGRVAEPFDRIINVFRSVSTEKCEIVATLFSAWQDLLNLNPNVSDDLIVDEVLENWHESKKRIDRSRWMNALEWMREKGFAPNLKK